jgi:hypothetical protein
VQLLQLLQLLQGFKDCQAMLLQLPALQQPREQSMAAAEVESQGKQ